MNKIKRNLDIPGAIIILFSVIDLLILKPNHYTLLFATAGLVLWATALVERWKE